MQEIVKIKSISKPFGDEGSGFKFTFDECSLIFRDKKIDGVFLKESKNYIQLDNFPSISRFRYILFFPGNESAIIQIKEEAKTTESIASTKKKTTKIQTKKPAKKLSDKKCVVCEENFVFKNKEVCEKCFEKDKKCIKCGKIAKAYMSKCSSCKKGIPPKEPQSYAGYLESDLWKDIKQRVLKEKGRICFICKKCEYQCIHHQSYKKKVMSGEDISPLYPLCLKCHSKVHFNGSRQLTYHEWSKKFNTLVGRSRNRQQKKSINK